VFVAFIQNLSENGGIKPAFDSLALIPISLEAIAVRTQKCANLVNEDLSPELAG